MKYLCGLAILSAIWTHFGTASPQFSRLDIFQPNFHQTHRYRDTRSVDTPNVEVVMHLPPEFKTIEEFKRFFGIRPERKKRSIESNHRDKREAVAEAAPQSANVESSQLLVEGENEPFAEFQVRRYPDAVLELVDGRPNYSQYANLNPTNEEETDDPRKRRNTSANDHEDKRSFPDMADATTAAPFWKPQKSNLPFVTSREGRKNAGYDNAQHRSGSDSSREAHSMKEPTKTMASNEITPRMQDNYYSGTSSTSTRRVYNSRQSDSPPPKSVYDTIDYSSTARRGQSRNADSTGRLTDSYGYRQPTYSRPYDRSYSSYYPLPGDVGPRGVDYYHRTVDPGTGRIVYYASLPEPSPNYDPYTGRSWASRSYTYDTFGRAYPTYPVYPSYPYPMPEYLRNGRNIMEPFQQQRVDDRYRDEIRNKTYVIYDAEEKRPGYSRPIDDKYRYVPVPSSVPSPSYPAFPNYFNQPGYPTYPQQPYQPYFYRSAYPENRRLVGRDTNEREVQLPVSTRGSDSSYDKTEVKSLKP